MSSSERSNLRRARTLPFLLAFLLPGLQACQTINPTIPRTEVPASLKASCERPDGKEDVKTVADLASYSIRQDAALKTCDAKRQGLVTILEAVNPAKKRWGFR